jgi:hypothetical protein
MQWGEGRWVMGSKGTYAFGRIHGAKGSTTSQRAFLLPISCPLTLMG